MWWTSSCGGIELQITKAQAATCSHAGDCSLDVKALSQVPKIRRQLAKLWPCAVRNELREYGAWSSEELSDHDANLQRLLWLACCYIDEEVAAKQHK